MTSSLELRSVAAALRHRLMGARLVNVYDSGTGFLFKFNVNNEVSFLKVTHRDILLTDIKLAKEELPSPVCMRVRKHLRGKRLENIRHVGCSQAIDLQFGRDSYAVNIVSDTSEEIGNIFLLDAGRKILATKVKAKVKKADDPDDEQQRASAYVARHKYEVGSIFPMAELQGVNMYLPHGVGPSTLGELVDDMLKEQICWPASRRKKKFGIPRLMNLLRCFVPFVTKPAEALDIIIKAELFRRARDSEPFDISSLLPSMKTESGLLNSITWGKVPPVTQEKLQNVIEFIVALEEDPSSQRDSVVELISIATRIAVLVLSRLSYEGAMGKWADTEEARLFEEFKGVFANTDSRFVTATVKTDTSSSCVSVTDIVKVSGLCPYLNLVHLHECSSSESQRVLCIDADIMACYVMRENARSVAVKVQQSAKAQKKQVGQVEAVRSDQLARISGLETSITKLSDMTEAIEHNMELVEDCLKMMLSLVATGEQWDTIWHLVKEQKKEGHPIAVHFKSVVLEESKITLILPNPCDQTFDEDYEYGDSCSDSDSIIQLKQKLPPVMVPLDLNLNARNNIERLHDERKAAKDKMMRSEAALKLTVRKITKKVEREKTQNPLKATGQGFVRKPMWFERFNWFISSEGYLSISGRDAGQNDFIYRRYFNKNDLYLHADIHGAATVVIKNRDPEQRAIPHQSILEAAQFAVCRSSAWKAKIIASAYWVYPSQVSKTTETGEFISKGGFVIRGKKNYLPPMRLEMGIGLMYRISDDCIHKHKGERRPIGVLSDQDKELEHSPEGAVDLDRYGLQSIVNGEEDNETRQVLEGLKLEEERRAQMKTQRRQEDKARGMADDVRGTSSPSKALSRRGKSTKKGKDDDWDSDEAKPGAISLLLEDQRKVITITPHVFATDGVKLRGRAKVKERKRMDKEKRLRDAREAAGIPEDVEELSDPEDTFLPPKPPKKLGNPNETERDEISPNLGEESRILDSLTGVPDFDDELLYVIPVCFPWSSMKSHQFFHAAKLTPLGKDCKKSREAQALMQRFLKQPMDNRDSVFMLQLTVTDVTTPLIGGFKAHLPRPKPSLIHVQQVRQGDREADVVD